MIEDKPTTYCRPRGKNKEDRCSVCKLDVTCTKHKIAKSIFAPQGPHLIQGHGDGEMCAKPKMTMKEALKKQKSKSKRRKSKSKKSKKKRRKSKSKKSKKKRKRSRKSED